MSARSGGIALIVLASTMVHATPAAQTRSPAPASAAASSEPSGPLDRARALMRAGQLNAVLTELRTAESEIARLGAAARIVSLLLEAQAHRRLADLGSAERAAQAAWALARTSSEPALRVDTLTTLADLDGDRGNLESRARWLEQAVPDAERSGNGRLVASVWHRVGTNLRALGRPAEAIDAQDKALTAARAVADQTLVIQSLTARATVRLGIGEYDRALADAQDAYDLASPPATADSLRATAIFGLAQVHAHIRNLERAAELWGEAIETYRRASVAAGVALATRQRMDTWFALGDFDRAAADGEAALALLTASGVGGAPSDLLGRLALIEVRRGRADASHAYAMRARELAASTPPRRRISIETDLGFVALLSARHADARDRFRLVLDLARELDDPDYEWRARYGLGRTNLEAGDPAAAERDLRAGIAIIERMRRMFPEAGLRAAFLGDRLGPYESLIDALAAQAPTDDDSRDGRHARQALEIAEQGRGRALADLLAEARARVTDPAVAAIRDQELAFGRRLSVLQRAVGTAADPAARARAAAALADAEAELDALVVRIRRTSPSYGALAYPRSLTAAAIAQLPAADQALAVFWIGERRSHAWIVRHGTVMRHDVPGRAVVDREVRILLGAVAAHDAAATRRAGARLYTLLLAPAVSQLAGVTTLTVIPDGPLHRLPFALLRAGGEDAASGRWLVQDIAIAYAPSATLLAELRARPGADRPGPDRPGTDRPGTDRHPAPLLAIAAGWPGTPAAWRALFEPSLLPTAPLAHAEGEVRDIARLLMPGARAAAGGTVLTGARATETGLKRLAAQPGRVLHVAAHALVDDPVPRRSAILLQEGAEDDGLLQMNEIATLTLDVDLVVLAACRSHLGRTVRGEGLVGLSRAFMHAGARAVAASVWSVDDRATRRLMRPFYAGLQEGVAPAHALRLAQLQMLHAGRDSADPQSWAGFIVSGHATDPLFDAPPPASPPGLTIVFVVVAMVLVGAAVDLTRRARRASSTAAAVSRHARDRLSVDPGPGSSAV